MKNNVIETIDHGKCGKVEILKSGPSFDVRFQAVIEYRGQRESHSARKLMTEVLADGRELAEKYRRFKIDRETTCEDQPVTKKIGWVSVEDSVAFVDPLYAPIVSRMQSDERWGAELMRKIRSDQVESTLKRMGIFEMQEQHKSRNNVGRTAGRKHYDEWAEAEEIFAAIKAVA